MKRLALTLSITCAAAFSAAVSNAALVTWDLNPSGLNQPVGSSSRSYTVSGYTIIATGWDNLPGVDTQHQLYYKNAGPSETGLGITGPSDFELQASGGVPVQYIQLDLTSILSQGFTNGQIMVGSVQPDETFALYGSNAAGTLGILLGNFGSASDVTWINAPAFGTYNFLSVGATNADVLPVAFRASITPVPEMSALFPIVGLLAAVASTRILRRRAARSNVS